MKDFLQDNGYNLWKTEEEEHGATEYYQSRVDTNPTYMDYPLCTCNDKLFINIEHYKFQLPSIKTAYDKYTLKLVHSNVGGDWCDLQIYGLTEEQLRTNLRTYETKLLNMWKVFYGEE